MKVGDYVRFYDRGWTEIGQIVDEVEDSHLKVVKCRDGYYDLDNFIKSSPNIIDLIEVGDYVNGKKVCCFRKENCDYDIGFQYNDDFGEWYGIDADEIESIITKEQIKAMEYKIER